MENYIHYLEYHKVLGRAGRYWWGGTIMENFIHYLEYHKVLGREDICGEEL